MKSHWAIILLLGATTLSSCTLLRSGESSRDSSMAAESPSPSASASLTRSADQTRPDTRVMSMAIEGKVIEMELRLFDRAALPFTTYVPIKDFQNEVNSSTQGTVAQFFFSPKGKKNNAAYVQVFLPAQPTSIDEMRNLLLGDQGLLASNDWQLVDRTDIVSYSWAREKLIYQQRSGKEKFLGSIYIGENQGRSFYALTHYPAEYIDGFEPRSTIMLENLQFRNDSP